MTTSPFTGCIHFANPVREQPTKGDYKMSESFNNTPSKSKAPRTAAYHARDNMRTAKASVSRSKPFLSTVASASAFHRNEPSNRNGRVSQPAHFQFKGVHHAQFFP